MPSAYRDAKGWIAQFRGLNQPKEQRQLRVRIAPALYASMDEDERPAFAQRFATTCEALCRSLEGPHDATVVRTALQMKAISKEQGAALLNQQPAPAPGQAKAATTIEQAFLAHPSTRSMPADGRERWRYLDAIAAFSKWSQVKNLDGMTLDLVQRWRDELAKRDLQWDSRRHMLLPLRRAAMMAGNFALPNVLGRLKLDPKERRPMVQAWTLAELTKAIQQSLTLKDYRTLVVIGLGAFMGLRPSEIATRRKHDLGRDDRIAIGLQEGREREAKTEASRRLLPVPPTLAGWMRQLGKLQAGMGADSALVLASFGNVPKKGGPNKNARPFTPSAFGNCFRPIMEDRTGRRLPIKSLRKSFATWTRREGINRDHIEVYLGHETEFAQGITGRHYTAGLHEMLADELGATCARIEAVLSMIATPEPHEKRKSLEGIGSR